MLRDAEVGARRRPALPAFRPPPGLAGGHRQTLIPHLLRRGPAVAYRRERLDLPDGDFLDLDWIDGADPARVAVVAHGLEGSTQRAYVRGMAAALAADGWTVCAWNLRGCSGEPNRLLRAYHSGATDDLDAVVRHVTGRGATALCLVGFSLGGNLTLRWLGEKAGGVPSEVVGAVGISVPVDLAGASRAMERGLRRAYVRHFLRKLSAKARQKADAFDGAPDATRARAARTFHAFDDGFTAPIHGYASADDYYARASARPLLTEIAVPTLLVNALDDPFLGPTCYPSAEAATNPRLTLLTPRTGGHVGFLQRDGRYWSEAVAVRFLRAALEVR